MKRRGRHPEADDRSEEQAIIVGFDAEWVDASHEDHDLPPDTSNRILSWQLFLLNPNTGRSCGIFVEPKSGRKASRKLLTDTDWPGHLQGAEGGRARPHPVSHHSRGSLQPGRSLNPTGFRKPEAEGGCGTNDLRHDNQASLRPHPDRSGRGASLGADRRYHAAQPGPFWARRPWRGLGLPKIELPRRLLERAHGPLPRSRSRQLHRLCDDRCRDRCPVDGPGAQNRARRDGRSSRTVQRSAPSPCRCCATRSKRRA